MGDLPSSAEPSHCLLDPQWRCHGLPVCQYLGSNLQLLFCLGILFCLHMCDQGGSVQVELFGLTLRVSRLNHMFPKCARTWLAAAHGNTELSYSFPHDHVWHLTNPVLCRNGLKFHTENLSLLRSSPKMAKLILWLKKKSGLKNREEITWLGKAVEILLRGLKIQRDDNAALWGWGARAARAARGARESHTSWLDSWGSWAGIL